MFRGIMLFAFAVALLVPATASAAKPAVITGAAASVAQSTATLNGKIDANGKATTYFFQLGTTKVYSVTTAETAGGGSAKPVRVAVPVGGLAPNTLYHYRLVAKNADGQTLGADRTFRTKRQPLGVTLSATPNPLAPGASTALVGQLTGTSNANRDVVLQSNPFPYTQGFANAGNPLVTDAQGNFSFPVLSVPMTTQFRVVMPQRQEVASPIVIVGAALQVTTRTKKVERHRRSVSVRFRGDIRPAAPGVRVAIQRLRNDVWTTFAHTRAQSETSSRSSYSTRVRLSRSGTFRVVAESDGAFVSGLGRPIGMKVRR
ncbi:MAG TPA: hypothetical protein VK631_02645 [Solirubrobacteraceae bacterium]|nr:hypothetical protein [Solirubrobacteraceae bacterium]